ncbi:MAG: wax ester/triacylglycerol synthase domain-containing protein, partial [Dermatophilaceae bacterium]
TPLGCGGPVWVDHAQFNVCRHVREVACRLPGDEQALLDTAMSVLTTPLSRDEPLWTFSLVTGQHRLHTLVTHVRGPAEHLTFGGVRVSWAAAAAVAEGGNSPVYFGVLSYAGTVSVTAIVDPDHFPELDELAAGLAYWLSSIMKMSEP